MDSLKMQLSPLQNAIFDTQTSQTMGDWGDFDRRWHAFQGRITFGLSPIGSGLAFIDWLSHLINAPYRRAMLAGTALTQLHAMWRAATGEIVIEPQSNDHRFRDPAWQNAPFSFLQQCFLLTEDWWRQATINCEGVSSASSKAVAFTTRQMLDVVSPSNMAWLNPEVIRATVSSGGANLRDGVANFVSDLREMASSAPSGQDGLQVGRELAVTPGKVVFRNELMELIQYAPSTTQVRPEPVLIVPAWIMKYYILDLSPSNSLIGSLVAQGHTVFAISWRNPTAELHHLTLDDYRTKGVIKALDAIGTICGDGKVHACGYCLGGTLLAIAAAAMARDDDNRLASMTLFCAQTDFSEPGELQLFISEDQLAFLDDIMQSQGYLDSRQMAGAFQMLRSNDLVWSHAIKSYLLGQREHSNDLMTWNADGTRMPAYMHSEYLRRLFLNNELAEGRFPAGDKPVSLGDIHLPFFVVGTETDHIAPWHSVYKIHLLNGSDMSFVLTSGGHNAGVVSEPGHPNRHYRFASRQEGERYRGPKEWLETAELRQGSWWLDWWAWLDTHSSKKTKPPAIGSEQYPSLADAPGQYVMER